MFTGMNVSFRNCYTMMGRTSCLFKQSELSSRNVTSQVRGLSKISHVVFDFDGVILDTETIFYDTNIRTLKQYGLEYTIDLKLGQMGRRLDEGTSWLLEATGLAQRGVTTQEYIEVYEKFLDAVLDKIPELPGARHVIEHLHKSNVPIAICTGSATNEFNLKKRSCQDLIDKFPLVVLAGDDSEVKHGKPAPDPYLVTMKRIRPVPGDPKQVLVFEDSVNGVLSGLAAGNTVIWIPQEQFKPKNWDQLNAELGPKVAEILPSMEAFNPVKYGLPPY